MRIRYTRAARADLIGIQDYIAQRNPRAAFRVADRIRSRIDDLARFPQSGRGVGHSGQREIIVVGTPYVVVYRITQSTVEVLSIVHGHRKRPL